MLTKLACHLSLKKRSQKRKKEAEVKENGNQEWAKKKQQWGELLKKKAKEKTNKTEEKKKHDEEKPKKLNFTNTEMHQHYYKAECTKASKTRWDWALRKWYPKWIKESTEKACSYWWTLSRWRYWCEYMLYLFQYVWRRCQRRHRKRVEGVCLWMLGSWRLYCGCLVHEDCIADARFMKTVLWMLDSWRLYCGSSVHEGCIDDDIVESCGKERLCPVCVI